MHFMMVRYADLPKRVDLPPDCLTVRLITSDQNAHPMQWNWVGNPKNRSSLRSPVRESYMGRRFAAVLMSVEDSPHG